MEAKGEKKREVSTGAGSQNVGQLWWIPIFKFAVHVFVGTGLFLIICIPAVGLDVLLRWLPSLKVSDSILIGLKIAELALFFLDLFLFLVFLLNAAWIFIKSINWKDKE